VLFIGYAEAALGLGEAFRSLLTALARTSIPFAIYPFNVNVETRRIGPFLQERYDREGRYDVNVAYMATDQLPLALRELGPQRTAASYNILRTYWELPRAPAAWAPLLENVQELWAPSAFVADAFRDVFRGSIAIIPPCVTVERQTRYERAHFSMNEGRFYYLFSFDYYSRAVRKNPLGVLRAFSAAFPDRREDVGLVIKSTGPTKLARDVAAQIKAAARKDARIVVIESSVSRDEVLSLIEQSDCYVSLHRSEGFGLGMAEALAFGKPVIGTDFSGATDFLSAETGYPVPFTLRKLTSGEYFAGEGQSWAEPDPGAAVEIMRRVFYDRAENARRGAAGKALVESRYGYDSVARVVTERLQEIQNERARATAAVTEV
jgi:glycosyltransferase involved in cell wall biosynthesis